MNYNLQIVLPKKPHPPQGRWQTLSCNKGILEQGQVNGLKFMLV